MDTSVESLSQICRLEPDRFCKNAFILTFEFEGWVVTTVRIGIDDAQSGAELAITNMTTFPVEARGKGYGAKALRSLLVWAHATEVEKIQAVQVQAPSETFWTKNHFRKIGNITNDFEYVCNG